MLKRFLFAVAPMMLVAGSVMADDSLLSKVASMDLDENKIAAVDVDDLGQADVDALLGDDEADGEEAIAACFRRNGWGYGYRSHYRSCYRPTYRSYNFCHSYFPRTYCYTPVSYSCYTPVYRSYWGCW